MWKHGMIQCSKKYIEAIGKHGRKEIGWHCKGSIFLIFGVIKGTRKDITNNHHARKVNVYNMQRLNFMS
jgi:hypothetical protein